MKARVFNKSHPPYSTPAKVLSIIMEDALRPRKAAAWTTEYSEKGRSDSVPGSNLQNFEIKKMLNAHRPRRIELGRDAPWPIREEEYDARNYSDRPRERTTPRGCYLEDMGEPVRDYLSRSSMHGLRYIGESNLHWVERTFWTVAFVLAVLCATYYITILYHKWENEPVIVSISPRATPLISIPFPAVTICNMNRAKKSEADVICNASNSENENLLNDLCGQTDSCHVNSTTLEVAETNMTKKWKAIQRFLVKVSPSCNDMLKTCMYGGEVDKCEDMFNPSLTDEGLCCTFNRVHREHLFKDPRDLSDLNVSFPKPTVDWKPEQGYPANATSGSVPRRPMGAGSHLGLTLVLNNESDEYFCSSTSSMGFKMLLHSPVETPKIAGFGIALSPGQEYHVAVKPYISRSLDNVRDVLSSKRRCVFADERRLRFYRTYTRANCALECEANYTLARCNCVLQYMPKNNTTPICGRLEAKCAEAAKRSMELRLVDQTGSHQGDASASDPDVPSKPQCECLPGCYEINYEGEATSSGLLELRMISDKKHLVNITDDVEFKKNMAVVHLFFTETQFQSLEKGELFGFTEFLSSTGGLLGLFLGFSFLSVVEIFYHLTLKLWCMTARGKNAVSASQIVTVGRGRRFKSELAVSNASYPYAP